MTEAVLCSAGVYTWVVLPVLIFAARVVDVSLGTVRVIFVSRGLKYLAPLVGFFEILIWLLAIGQIMKNLSSPACYVAYAGGFAMGNYTGIVIAEKLSLGMALVRVITREDPMPLVEQLRAENYGVTTVDGQGARGPVKVLFTIVPRRQASRVISLVEDFNPRAFYTIEEVGRVEKGILPLSPWAPVAALMRTPRPFRKGK